MRGKAVTEPEATGAPQDHPRVCGEKDVLLDGNLFHPGSPPRVRGKAKSSMLTPKAMGITPACAGKSGRCAYKRPCIWDHPRVCGEKLRLIRSAAWFPGSPPRVRGKEIFIKGRQRCYGITPACAGKSCTYRICYCSNWDHPRVCGEKAVFQRLHLVMLGSPPRVRGKAGSSFGC